MKKTVTKEVELCDGCGKEVDYGPSCMICGKVFCYDCGEKMAVKYNAGVYVSNGDDGEYCLECDLKSANTPLHKAYLKVKSLREEMDDAYESFNKRRAIVERDVKTLKSKQ